MLFSISGKKSLKQNNIGGAILIGVEVGDGWFVRLTRFARGDGLQIAGDCTSGLLYTPSRLCGNWLGRAGPTFN